MKKYIVIIILLIVVFLIYQVGLKSNAKKEYYENGAIKAYYPIGNDQIDGEVIEYFENGNVKSKVRFVKGIQDGRAVFYYPNGAIKREVNFKSGVQQDTMKVYYENGNLMELSFLVDGVKNGAFTEYYENGKIKSRGTAKDGDREGEWFFYQQDESLDHIAFFIHGQEASTLHQAGEYYSYENRLLKYSLSILSSFEKVEEKQDYVLFALEKEGFKPSINVLVRPLPNDVNLNGFIDNEVESIKDLTSGFTLRDKKRNGQSIIISYMAKYENYKVKVSTLFVEREDHVFIVTFMSEFNQDYEDEIDLVFDSFSLES